MDRIQSDLEWATRFIKRVPLEADALGDVDFEEKMNRGLYGTIANPWDEDDFIAVAVKEFDAEELRPNPARVQKMTRGFLKRNLGGNLGGDTPHARHQRGGA